MQELARTNKAESERKRLVLMRGLPSCGKSWTAKKVAEESNGVLFEFDSFFEVDAADGSGDLEFAWDSSRLPEARLWHVQRVKEAIESGLSPIVIDDDHRPGKTAKVITAFAMMNNYVVEFAEPESSWWKAIRPLLGDKEASGESLAKWAQKLCTLSRRTHNVGLNTFVSRIENWEHDLSPLDLISWGELPAKTESDTEEDAA